MQKITHINRNEAEARHFYNLVAARHEAAKLERTETHAKHAETQRKRTACVTVGIFVAAVLAAIAIVVLL